MKTNKENLKNGLFTLAMVLISIAGFAQDAIDRYFKAYADDPESTSILISSKMFSLFSEIDTEDPDSKEALEAMSGLEGIRIITLEGEPGTNYRNLVSKVGKEYELLMSVDEQEEKVRFFVLEEGNEIRELFMIVGGNESLFLMSIVGDIDLKKMSSLSKSMNVGGMNYLENLDEDQKKK
jgi:hypothetical protein